MFELRVIVGFAVLSLGTACSDAAPQGQRGDPAPAMPAGGPASERNEAGIQVFGGDFDGAHVQFSLEVLGDGSMARGTLEGLDEPMAFEGRRQGAMLAGHLLADDESVPVTGTIAGDSLQLDIGPDPGSDGEVVSLLLRRGPTGAAAMANRDTSAPMPASATIVNDEPVPEPVRQELQQKYNLRIGAGDFWYDRVSGAWGLKGGPTVGYIVAGLDLGGPLRADASGGGTPVIVNGRVLHPYDLMGLQMLVGPVAPGRYFLDANSNVGLEGGPPLLNLLAWVSALQQHQRLELYGPGWGGGGNAGGDGSGDNFWSSGITGAAGNESDGAGYVMVDGVAATYGM